MLFINNLLLLTVAFLPFPTKLVADYLRHSGGQAATLAYAAQCSCSRSSARSPPSR